MSSAESNKMSRKTPSQDSNSDPRNQDDYDTWEYGTEPIHNDHTWSQLNEFEKVISHDVDLITDKYSNNQILGFKQNRHDQSIFSLISKIYGCVELENEVWFKDNPENQYEFPFLAVQRGPYSYSEKLKFYLFYKKHLKQTYYFGKDLYFYQKPSIIKRLKFKLEKL